MEGIVNWMESSVWPWLQAGGELVMAVWICVVLPLLLFRKSRRLAATILVYTSYYMGFSCWWFSFIVTYRVLGLLWLVAGFLFMGVGVVPLAVAGVFLKSLGGAGLWPTFWNLILALASAFIPRVVSVLIVHRITTREEAEARHGLV
jgi:hypothetical protein